MAELATGLARPSGGPAGPVSDDVLSYLKEIGYLEPDPSPPPALPTRPTHAVLLLTNRCNLRCIYCYASGGEGPVLDLSPELARVVIDRVCQNALDAAASYFDLCFHGGGEPMQAWSTVQEATRYARQRPLPCNISLVSNGVWTDRQRAWIVDNLDSVSVSFDGGRLTQNGQRPFASGSGSFKTVMRSLRALDRAGYRYAIRMTATAPWRERLPEDIRFIVSETACRAIQVEPAFNTRRGSHQAADRQASEAFSEAFMAGFEIAQRVGCQLVYSGARPWLVARSFCSAPYTTLVVNPLGKLVACLEVADNTHPLATLYAVGRIDDSGVVEDAAARARLWDRLEARRVKCLGCFCYWHCAGDCYPRASDDSPDGSHTSSPRCDMNREITARLLLWNIMANGGFWRRPTDPLSSPAPLPD
jgi:uncharacterized protein